MTPPVAGLGTERVIEGSVGGAEGKARAEMTRPGWKACEDVGRAAIGVETKRS